MTEKELQHLIDKYTSGRCNQKEQELMDKVLDGYNETEAPLIELEEETLIQDEIYSNIIKKRTIPTKTQPNTKYKWLKISAAIVLLLFSLSAVFYNVNPFAETEVIAQKFIIKSTEWGQRSTLKLQDGTKISLNAGSSIEFPESFNEHSTRDVKLIGEAFFEVAKNPNKPFIIHTENVTTQVLGTSFNVNAYDFSENISVTVRTGKVRVQSENKDGDINTVYLAPNQMAEYSKKGDELITSTVANENYLDWKNGIIRFNDITFLEASKMLTRWYGIEVDFQSPALKNCHITARYEKAKLHVVLESIKFATKGMDYEYLENNTILLKGSCNH
ncbi:FecR family protein [Zobellia amurskyensis]|uniref:FecR family protein n=1 Tax=Zobellia amurskyensis TaxID=248905 RepID=A0A7X3D2B1_9FLAO|nr:FecR domain-containing protein [Zobellia amurskyensis]MUH36931.1 FecR family protein [Zobellia amurskyensis]